MEAVARAVFFLTLFLSFSSHVISFPFLVTADTPQTATDFLNYGPHVMKSPVDDQSITGLLPEPPISSTVGVPVESGKEPSVTVSAPTAAPVEGGNEPSETVGVAPVEGGNAPTEGSESSRVNGGIDEQEPSDHGSPGLLAPTASPIPSTPAAAAPVGGLNGPFGQRQQQQQLEGSVNGEEQDLGAQPLVDNTPFDSGSTKVGYFSFFCSAGAATAAFFGMLV